MNWLVDYNEAAKRTDRFAGRSPHHVQLLATGLLGEAGSIAAEFKKEERERNVYPAYRRKMLEELGDFLWYYVRLVAVLDPDLIPSLDLKWGSTPRDPGENPIHSFLELGSAVGILIAEVNQSESGTFRPLLDRVWRTLLAVSEVTDVPLEYAAEENIAKTISRWPVDRIYIGLFDEGYPEEEQLPRELDVEFRERTPGDHRVVLLRCNNLNFGDRLTDNIEDPDGYRYHDIFHFSYAVHLGWSPVIRSLLRCKRKSNPAVDEAQDGARAAIVEEAVASIAFTRAKQIGFFDGLSAVDYNLLKTVKELVAGYEVSTAPLWQWEFAILEGFAIFRQLRNNHGGRVLLDLRKRTLRYVV